MEVTTYNRAQWSAPFVSFRALVVADEIHHLRVLIANERRDRLERSPRSSRGSARRDRARDRRRSSRRRHGAGRPDVALGLASPLSTRSI
jgi:hypothetical protein